MVKSPGFGEQDNTFSEMANGYLVVHFLLPGGEQDGVVSGSEYDYRGPDCIVALRDVIRYAAGELEGIGTPPAAPT